MGSEDEFSKCFLLLVTCGKVWEVDDDGIE